MHLCNFTKNSLIYLNLILTDPRTQQLLNKLENFNRKAKHNEYMFHVQDLCPHAKRQDHNQGSDANLPLCECLCDYQKIVA